MTLLSNPTSLADWAGDPPSASDWDKLETDVRTRLDVLRRFLPLPFPLGVERSLIGQEDSLWVEGQYAQAVGLMSSVRGRPTAVAGGRQTFGHAVLWCASFDREFKRRRRMARLFRLLTVVGTLLLFLMGGVGYQQMTQASDPSDLGRFLGGVVESLLGGWLWLARALSFLPGLSWLSGAAWRDAVGLFLLGGGISLLLGLVLCSHRLAQSPWIRLIRVLLWSNLTILAVLVSGEMGGVLSSTAASVLPDTIAAFIHPKKFFFFFGYFIPIVIFGGSFWHIFKPPKAGWREVWWRLVQAFRAFRAEMPAKEASPPGPLPQSAPQ